MARKTIRIDLPTSKPDEMILLAEAIDTQHTKLAAASPLNDAKVKAMAARARSAREKRAQADVLDAQAQALRADAATLIGLGAGQTADTKDTLVYDVTGFRDILLTEFRGSEDELQPFGFAVVIGTARIPAAKTATPAKP